MFDTFIGPVLGNSVGSSYPTLVGSPAAPTLITAAGGLTIGAGSPFIVAYVKGNGGPVMVTATPSITTAGITAGTLLAVIGTDSVNTVTFQTDTDLAGSKLTMNGPVILDAINTIWFILGTNGFWRSLGTTK